MKRLGQYIIIVVLFGYYIACAPVKFDKDAEVNKCQNFGQSCVSVASVDNFDYTVTAPGGLVDVVFINDNSGSMSFEQRHMADRFSRFLAELDARFVDYRIGVVSTDISNSNVSSNTHNPPRAINQSGALQDGKLIAFSDGSTFLIPGTQGKESLFAQAIQRAETSTCEQYMKENADTSISAADYSKGLFENCPSGDERGLAAANLFVTKNPESFIRNNAHLAIVLLSDEDGRSGLYYTSPNYRLSTDDLPQTLIENVKKVYGAKTVSVHSIIVKPGTIVSGQTAQSVAQSVAQVSSGGMNTDPKIFFSGGDVTCLGTQSNQLNIKNTSRAVSGSYGYLYYLASALTGGIVGDLCALDYTSQLQDIGVNIANRLSEIQLACANPKDLSVEVSPNVASITDSVEGSLLKFSSLLAPGTRVHLKYSCPTL